MKNINIVNNSYKCREKINKIKNTYDLSNNFNELLDHSNQKKLINKLFLGEDFIEKKIIISELKNKINSYKQQDIKKDIHENKNLITIDNIIEKLLISKLLCYYCNKKIYIIFDKVRDNNQWTLDRINNFDEHTNDNTIITCLGCNLQRRRKNSEKFLFTKQLESKQIIIKKLD